MTEFVIGVDIGGTKLITALSDREGKIVARVQGATQAAAGPGAGLERIALLIKQAAAQAGVDPRSALAIGVGAPGPLDLERGIILDACNLGPLWNGLPLKERLEERFGVPVAITNDCKAGGLGEHRYGAGRGTSEMLYLGVGTGIAGCIISGGKLFYGASQNAGEIGHMVVDPNGPLCPCGARGCLEAISSGTGIGMAGRDAAVTAAGARLRALAGGVPARVDGAIVARAAAEGDPTAQAILDRAARTLGLAVGGLMNIVGPERVVLGGGVMAKNGAPFLAKVVAAAESQVLPGCGCPIVLAELGEESAVRGAVALALDHVAVNR